MVLYFDVSLYDGRVGLGLVTMVSGLGITMYQTHSHTRVGWVGFGYHGMLFCNSDVSTTVIWCYDRGGIIFAMRSIVLDQNPFATDTILQMSYCPWV